MAAHFCHGCGCGLPLNHLYRLCERCAGAVESKRREWLAGYKQNNVLNPAEKAPHGYFTCDTCGIAHKCEYSFDLYNTDGDCLGEK